MLNSHRRLCLIVAAWLRRQVAVDFVSWEMQWNGGYVDAIGFTSFRSKEKPRIIAVEVKKARGDLLADINSGKYRKYEYGTTHCYLAATPAALGIKKKADVHRSLADLKRRGFPEYWGVLLLPYAGNGKPKLLRAARSRGTVILLDLQNLAASALQALANKGLRKVDLD
jgi:hypothetical protein